MSRRRKKRGLGGFILGLIELILGIGILVALAGVAAYFFCPLKNVSVEGTDCTAQRKLQTIFWMMNIPTIQFMPL